MTRPPSWHYQRADELLASEMLKRDPTLAISRATVAQAAMHAALAQYGSPRYDITVNNSRSADVVNNTTTEGN